MKQLNLTFLLLLSFSFLTKAQVSNLNLKGKNLHKKVRKVIQHYYSYDKESGGFVKQSVNIDNFNDDGNLIETYSLYNSKYSETSNAIKKLYNYNNKNQLINTQDVSDVKGKYSSTKKYFYNNKGNLVKEETHFNPGKFSYKEFKYDKKNREISSTSYSESGKLTGERTNTYSGDKKTNTYTSYNSKDGSIIGTYVTYYEDGVKTKYTSNSKYSNSNKSYIYDDNDNLIRATNTTSDKKSDVTYNYVYDKKDNWVKKHYRSGKYQYFYFREIYFSNGDVTGSTNFDKYFINLHGNFDNVAVVPLKKKVIKKTPKKNKNENDNPLIPNFKSKSWKYTYANLNGKVLPAKGSFKLNVTDGPKMNKGNTVSITIKMESREKDATGYYKIDSFLDLGEGKKFWMLNHTSNKDLTTSLTLYDKPEYIAAKNIYIKGIFLMNNKVKGQKTSFYLE
ncbi:hypothetical protein LPB136_09165 [Tenacibaculum todarodis]|uniref:Uncharacterized protein n=1 Tax=Tenacibaculum todarodis TaxID=1850252 RepID=A0A1L3JK74_9FLAO|nr:hypothetical protein [Tenacibaculum todarodis]APG65517.1 hypothetical protein LPB136_09165 [Tenacibaculum todarodis]